MRVIFLSNEEDKHFGKDFDILVNKIRDFNRKRSQRGELNMVERVAGMM